MGLVDQSVPGVSSPLLGREDGDDGPNNSESRAYEVMME